VAESPMRTALLLTAALAALGACGQPQGPCAAPATRELRIIDQLIQEQRAVIDRGYVLGETGRPGVEFCLGGGDRSGVVGVGVSFCADGTPRRPIAIDRAAEGRKLDALLAKREELLRRIEQDAQACAEERAG
jgi:hypothetical protein